MGSSCLLRFPGVGPRADQVALALVATWFILRAVPEPEVKQDTPDGAHQAENPECLPPTEADAEPADDNRCDCSPEARRHPDGTLRQAALAVGEPGTDD